MDRSKAKACSIQCPVALTAAVIGDKWNVLIIRNLLLPESKESRFDDFLNSLGIARNILAQRLEFLKEQGIVDKKKYEEKPQRFVYFLTTKGLDLKEIIQEMGAWGERWKADILKENDPNDPNTLS
jgi:DNA-binding HxlR family transcriptional regulator